MDLDIYDQSYDFFCSAIKNKKVRILDLGCGPGNITKYLLAKRPGYKIEGIDIAANMISLAEKNNPGASFKIMDCRDIADLDAGYGGIISGFCVPYLSEKDAIKLIQDSYHLLSDSGILYLSFVEGRKDKSGFQTGSSGDRSYFYYYQLDDLKKLLDKTGFAIEKLYKLVYKRSETVSEIHTVIIAQKTDK